MPTLTVFGAFVAQLPEFLVWLAGIWLALLHWRRNARAALLALLAFLLLVTLRLVGGYLDSQLPALLAGAGLTTGDLGLAVTLSACARSGIAALAWGLVLMALFGGRRRPAPAPETR
jgi:hypothetical protein